jgi:hypothetical protein
MQLVPSVFVLSAAGEVDLEKEEAAARKALKPKRQRFEKYDDDFIDDSELEMVKGGGPTKTKFSGFYVTQVGQHQRLLLLRVDEPTSCHFSSIRAQGHFVAMRTKQMVHAWMLNGGLVLGLVGALATLHLVTCADMSEVPEQTAAHLPARI